MSLTSDGGIVIAGSDRNNFWFAKIDSLGNTIWNSTIQGKMPRVNSIIPTSNEEYILAGSDFVNSVGTSVWLAKVDSSGSLLWNRTYGTGFPTTIIQTFDGGYAIAGNRLHSSAFLMEIDSNGILKWDKDYGTGSTTPPEGSFVSYMAYSMVQADDGEGYLIVGQAPAPDGSLRGVSWICKTDASGNVQWNNTNEDGGLYSVVRTPGGGYTAVTSKGDENNPGNYIPLLIQMDSIGNMKWTKAYPGLGSNVLFAIMCTRDGGFALSGYTKPDGTSDLDGWLLKVDSAGNAQWNRTYGGQEDDILGSVSQMTDGGSILAGCSNSSNSGVNSLWIVRVDEVGTVPELSLPIIGVLITSLTILFLLKDRLNQKLDAKHRVY